MNCLINAYHPSRVIDEHLGGGAHITSGADPERSHRTAGTLEQLLYLFDRPLHLLPLTEVHLCHCHHGRHVQGQRETQVLTGGADFGRKKTSMTSNTV